MTFGERQSESRTNTQNHGYTIDKRFRPMNELRSDRLSLEKLKEHGLNGVPQHAVIPSDKLVDYILAAVADYF